MSWVLQDLGAPRRLNVLNVGPAVPETVELLHARGCRLSIADLFKAGIIEQQRHLDPRSLTARFREALWMVDGPLHVCLLWDFLNYLSPSALSAFNQALKPWITRHTRAHAFCAAKRAAPLMQHRYGVVSAGQILQTRVLEQQQANPPAPWRHVCRQLNLFEAFKGTLGTGGVVELSLQGAQPQSTETATQQLGGDAGRARPAKGQTQTRQRHRLGCTGALPGRSWNRSPKSGGGPSASPALPSR